VILKFFIDGKNFECLKQSIPPESNCYPLSMSAAFCERWRRERVSARW
jgi:hypothetical protein